MSNSKQGTYYEATVHSRGQKITCICNSLSLGPILILRPVVRIWRKYINRNKVLHSFQQLNSIRYFPEIIKVMWIKREGTPHGGPGVDWVSNRNEYQDIFWGLKAAGAFDWQPYHLHVLIVLKSWSLNSLEPSGPVRACNGFALPFTFTFTFMDKTFWYQTS